MGRAKVTLKRIENERARKLTFVCRKKGLIKKISEFPADACLIIHDHLLEPNAEPVTWPQEPEKLNSFLQRYDHLKKKTETRCERFGVEDFFDIKNGNVEAEISKVRKEILKVKYPCWNPCFSNLSVDELRNFIVMLNAKVGLCDRRINMLKQNQEVEGNYGLIQNMVMESEEVGVVQNFYVPENQKTVNENAVAVDSHVNVSRPMDSRNLSESSNLPEFMEWAQKTVSANSLLLDSQIDVSGPSESRNQILGEFMECGDFQKTLNVNSVMMDSKVDVSGPSESRNFGFGDFVEWDDLQVDVSQPWGSRNLQPGEPLVEDDDWANKLEDWADKLVEDDDWVNQLLEDWDSPPDIPFL